MSKVIVFDPGHGRDKLGRWRRPLMRLGDKTYREDMGTLEIASAAVDSLFWSRGAGPRLAVSGYSPLLTRIDERGADRYLHGPGNTFERIRRYAQEVEADALVSIHTNAGPPGARGVVGFCNGDDGLAWSIVRSVAEATGMPIRKVVENKRLGVLRGMNGIANCLIECGFHTNPMDLEILTSPDGLEIIGRGIAAGVVEYFENLA